VPETIPEGFEGRDAIVGGIEKETMLGRAAALEDVGKWRPSSPPIVLEP
jgi:hypothetical protein